MICFWSQLLLNSKLLIYFDEQSDRHNDQEDSPIYY